MLILCTQVLVAYGNRVLSVPSGADPYAAKYKGIWVCLTILSRALSGNYVNFGVFDLYGDPALKVGRQWCDTTGCFVTPPCVLTSCRCHTCQRHACMVVSCYICLEMAGRLQDALAIALKMALAVPLADIMAYRKVGRAFFQLLEVLSHNHAPVLASTDTATFAFLVSGPHQCFVALICCRVHGKALSCAEAEHVGMRPAAVQMSALDAGLKSLDTGVSSQCAAAVDNLAGFYFKATHPEQPGAQPSPAAQVGCG